MSELPDFRSGCHASAAAGWKVIAPVRICAPEMHEVAGQPIAIAGGGAIR